MDPFADKHSFSSWCGVESFSPSKIGFLVETGVLTSSQKKELEAVIEESNQRRKQELEDLFSQKQELSEYYNNPPFILAGDLNSTVESPIYKNIVENHKLKDSAESYSPEPFTWNPPENKENHQYTGEFGLSVPDFGKTEVRLFFKEYDRRQRRIDYIFVSSGIQILSHNLFAEKENEKGVIGSDHFGVQIEVESQVLDKK